MPLPRPARVLKKRLRPLGLLFKYLGRLAEARRTAARLSVPPPPYETWLAVNRPTARADQDLRTALEANRLQLPRFSIIMPVYRPPLPLLQEAVASILAQELKDWELCIADDGGHDREIEMWLSRLAETEPRIQLIQLDTNRGIAEATNAAASLATGEVLVFLDQDDVLHPHCLAELGLYYATHPDTDLAYTDHDKLDADGLRHEPCFKPGWSPNTLLSHMYLGHAVSLRRELFNSLGGVRTGFEGAQDYDLILRAAERARHIGHIPRILYHWRVLKGSTAMSGDAKPESFNAGQRAVAEAMHRRGVTADVIRPEWAATRRLGLFSLRFQDEGPSVDVLLPRIGDRAQAITALGALAATTYRAARFLVADDENIPDLAALCKQALGQRVTLVRVAASDSIPIRLNSLAAASQSTLLVLANGSVTPLEPRWLTQMVGHHSLGAASVGGQQREGEHIIESGLMLDGDGDSPQPAFQGLAQGQPGYNYLALVARDCTAPSSRLLLVSRSDFRNAGGLNDEACKIDRCLIDLSLKLAGPGVVTPDAPFSCGTRLAPQVRRGTALPLDPFHNQNLARSGTLFTIRPMARPRLTAAPIRTVFVTHNLREEGAPRTLTDLAIGLHVRDATDSIVVSFEGGPRVDACQAASLQTVILPSDTEMQMGTLTTLLRDFNAEVLVASSLQSWSALEAAAKTGTPAILWQHESEPWETYFLALPLEERMQVYHRLRTTYRTTYVAEATRQLWSPITGSNSVFIPNALPPEALASKPSRSQTRASLNLPEDTTVILLPGTVCRRKGQIDAIRAFGQLPLELARRAILVVAGAQPEQDYLNALLAARARLCPEIACRIRITGAVPDMDAWLAASDIVLCTSRLESAPRVILEAMVHRRPIITTPVFGIPEMLPIAGQALFYRPGCARALSAHMLHLIYDEANRLALVQAAGEEFNRRLTFDDVLLEYETLIREAANSSTVCLPGSSGT